MPYVRQKPVFTRVNFILVTVKPDSSPSSVLYSAHRPMANIVVGESVTVTVLQETCSEAEPTMTLCLMVRELDSFQPSLLSCLCKYDHCPITSPFSS